jgi:chromosome partitioning protein
LAKIIAITNQKGGVGKTTTSVNLAASLAATKRRVLLIDLDPQGNATMGSGVDKRTVSASIYDVLVEGRDIASTAVPAGQAGFNLLPANDDLTGAEIALLDLPQREQRLKRALEAVQLDYDYILIDCPPSLNMLTLNALVATEWALIPMQCEYFALEGLSALVRTLDKIRNTLNPRLQVGGVLRTMFDPRNNLANDVSAQLVEHFGEKVYRTVIPRNVRVAEAPSHGLPVLLYDKASRGAQAYLALAGEILRRADQEQTAPQAMAGEPQQPEQQPV